MFRRLGTRKSEGHEHRGSPLVALYYAQFTGQKGWGGGPVRASAQHGCGTDNTHVTRSKMERHGGWLGRQGGHADGPSTLPRGEGAERPAGCAGRRRQSEGCWRCCYA